MNSFNNEDTFFELTQKAEQEEKDQHLQKCRVIHLRGAAYYNKDEDFKDTLDKIDLSVLTDKDGKITINLDSVVPFNVIILSR